jgi:hypothetical protein
MDGVATGSQETFFQIAATLIPILIFSGVIAERGGPQPRDSYRRLRFFAIGIPIFGAFAVMAEMVSISALVIGPRGGFWVGFVAMALAVGLVGVVVSVWLPWITSLKQKLPGVYRSLALPAGALLAVVFTGTVWSIYQSVDAANELERNEVRARTFKHRSAIHRRELGRVEAELEGKLRQQERLGGQRRADARTLMNATEKLATAEAEDAPAAILKILRARVRYEVETSEDGLELDGQLDKEIARLFEAWDKQIEELGRLRP